MNPGEKARVLRVLRQVSVAGGVAAGLLSLRVAMDFREVDVAGVLVLLVVSGTILLFRHWLTLRWKGD